MVTFVFLGVVPIVALGYVAIRRSPRRWWLWMALATLPLSVGAVLIQPLVVDPLFNRFEPLRDPHLKARILELADRAGIPGRHVYQVDKSRQTKTFNAYVNGFGVSQRIVLWDTMLQGMEEDEILFVMAHEMGHQQARAHLEGNPGVDRRRLRLSGSWRSRRGVSASGAPGAFTSSTIPRRCRGY
jgi:Zn-dependent protease with chaperone function